ncbi:MAG: NUDIX domain-containing protein [Alphaproteobacteria bacterium]|nr:NUDIX domain-containing protein [Alphaproteobacteria bacterium]
MVFEQTYEKEGRKYTPLETYGEDYPLAGAWGIIFDKKGNIFYTSCEGKVDLPGGCCEENETIEETFQREVMEEIGVSVCPESLHYLMSILYEYPTGNKAYLVLYTAQADKVLDKWERVEDEDEERGVCSLEDFLKMNKRKNFDYAPLLVEKLNKVRKDVKCQ